MYLGTNTQNRRDLKWLNTRLPKFSNFCITFFKNIPKIRGWHSSWNQSKTKFFKLKRLNQLEADQCERTDTQKGYRNETYLHSLFTRVGSLTLKVPRLRNGDFSTELFNRFQRSEQAFILH